MMSASDVLAVLALFDRHGLRAWIDGGWGIDALVGIQTRPHDDLDLVVDLRDVSRIVYVLSVEGFTVTEDERPARFVLCHPDGRHIDFHPVAFDGEGGGIQQLQDGRTFRYPPEGLAGTGLIAGMPVPCLTAELQVRCHLGYEPDTTDYHDMRLLHDRFGLPLPSPYDAEA